MNILFASTPFLMSNAKPSHLKFLTGPVIIFLGALLIRDNSHVISRQFSSWGLVLTENMVLKSLGLVVWFGGALLLSRLIITLVLDPFSRSKTGQNAPDIIKNSIYAVLFIVTGFMCIHYVFEKPIGALMATSGLVTLIIGLAIRDMIADFFSGLAINFERPYSIGDWIELEPGLVAKVTELNWRSTRLVTLSERTVIVPNNNFAGRQFVNYSLPKRSYRESIDITLNYTSDPERIENILQSAVSATEGLIDNSKHNVRIVKFTERGVVYQIRFWIDDLASKVALRHQLSANVLKYLNQAGISIPYQQQEVLLTRDRRPRKERRIDRKRLLSRIDWLEPLKDHELEQLAKVAKPYDFAKGESIFTEGETGNTLYLLVEGIAIARKSNNGNTKIVGKITPGQALGEMSVLTGAPRRASVFAETNIHAFAIQREDLEPILRARPEIASELGDLMAIRVNHMQQKVNGDSESQLQGDATSLARQFATRISHFFGIGHTH